MSKISETKPNKKEKFVLELFYNRFYNLYEELSQEKFFEKKPTYRFYKIRELFSVYKELLGYEPIQHYIKYIKNGGRPPLEGLIVDDLFSFVRNVLLHFPIFDNWEDVYISKDLATWNKAGTIHKFLLKSSEIKIDDSGVIKYRIWEKSKKLMTYIQFHLPEEYNDNSRIFLKEVISEKDGIKLCISFMKQVLDTQVHSDTEQDIVIMSQVYINMKDILIKKAEEFATKAHEGQTEKDINKTPYILHPKKVAELVAGSGGTLQEIAAAWLHDVVEDTPITIEIIESEFGSEIASIVKGLTDLPSFSELSIEQRKQKQAEHISTESESVRRVKLADQISAIELDGHNTLLDKNHRITYLEGAKKIAEKCKGISPFLDDLFTETYNRTIDFIKNN